MVREDEEQWVKYLDLANRVPVRNQNEAPPVPMIERGLPQGEKSDSILCESMERLKSASIRRAISEDGDLPIVRTDPEAHKAVLEGFTICMPRDAYVYVTLTKPEKRMLHAIKRRFGGSTEWRLSA
jgi:hypothetical protein